MAARPELGVLLDDLVDHAERVALDARAVRASLEVGEPTAAVADITVGMSAVSDTLAEVVRLSR